MERARGDHEHFRWRRDETRDGDDEDGRKHAEWAVEWPPSSGV